MFRVNRKENRIHKLYKQTFGDLNIREREHLQEWLANETGAFGEELLIIQKEFDGFDETRERLDLLAIDKQARLVIIENKLDDSGRDVTWQALKYAAYCSSLKKSQIISIYQSYLDRYCGGGNATNNLLEFLNSEDLVEVSLNPSMDQRIIFVAANFRKEVTATVMWLLERGIQVQCFRVTPFILDDELLIDMVQIIPPPEAAEFMIGIADKEQEERSAQNVQRRSHTLRLEFWEIMLTELRAQGLERYQTVNPSKDYWLSCGTGMSGLAYSILFRKESISIELIIQSSSQDRNKQVFDALLAEKRSIEADYGHALEWQRLEDRKSSRITEQLTIDAYDKENWPEMIDWITARMSKLQSALSDRIAEVNSSLKQS